MQNAVLFLSMGLKAEYNSPIRAKAGGDKFPFIAFGFIEEDFISQIELQSIVMFRLHTIFQLCFIKP